MDRDEFLNRKVSPLTVANYKKAFKKFDLFLDELGLREPVFIDQLKDYSIERKYKTLQRLIDYISNSVSPRSTKEYFGIICKYLKRNQIRIDLDEWDLDFPRNTKRRFEGLDRSKIEMILRMDDIPFFRAYYSLLYGAGLRETEALLITPRMIEFGTITRIKLPGTITKFNIERETFLAEKPANRLRELINSLDLRFDEHIFIKQYDENMLIPFEKHFAKIRNKCGLDTPNKQKHAQNDITLHSFRAFFITTLTDQNMEWFAHALTGHSKYMDTYYRKSLDERIKTFSKVAEFLNF